MAHDHGGCSVRRRRRGAAPHQHRRDRQGGAQLGCPHCRVSWGDGEGAATGGEEEVEGGAGVSASGVAGGAPSRLPFRAGRCKVCRPPTAAPPPLFIPPRPGCGEVARYPPACTSRGCSQATTLASLCPLVGLAVNGRTVSAHERPTTQPNPPPHPPAGCAHCPYGRRNASCPRRRCGRHRQRHEWCHPPRTRR